MYTIEWCKEQTKKTKRTFLPLRKCSFCGAPVGFIVEGEDRVFFDSNCDCSSQSSLRPTSFDEILLCITRQSTPEIQKQIADTLFGQRAPE